MGLKKDGFANVKVSKENSFPQQYPAASKDKLTAASESRRVKEAKLTFRNADRSDDKRPQIEAGQTED